MDEQQAIQRLKNNNIGGLEFLVVLYQVKAVRTAYLITRDIGLAEDVVQDSFLQAYRSIHGFDAARPFEVPDERVYDDTGCVVLGADNGLNLFNDRGRLGQRW